MKCLSFVYNFSSKYFFFDKYLWAYAEGSTERSTGEDISA